MAALRDQAQRKTGLVDVIAVRLADRAKSLDADGQTFAGHDGLPTVNATCADGIEVHADEDGPV